VTTRGVTLAAVLAVLSRPSWWLLALAGFLIRGGVLLFLLAIVMLPSPLVLSTILEPVIVPLALGGVDAGTLAPFLLATGLVLVWLLAGGWIGAATEVALIRDAREAMVDEGLPARPNAGPGRWLVTRVAIARLLAHIPTAVALGLGSIRIGSVAYLELTSPFEVTTPLVLRVLQGAMGPIVAIVIVWLFGEIVGGLAARRIVLDDASIAGGLRGAVGAMVHRPLATLIPALGTTMVLAIDLAALLGVVAFVWAELRDRLLDALADRSTLGVALVAFVATWVGALAITGLIDAWRGAAMTFEAERAAVAAMLGADTAPDPGGTFGASPGRRPGDWSAGDRGGSL
jgi:hypothetical protein